MPIRRPSDLAPSEITPPAVYADRRRLLAGALGLAATALPVARLRAEPTGAVLASRPNPGYALAERTNSWEDITTYNNYYEFGTDKSSPAANSGGLRTRPWSVTVSGEAEMTGSYALEDLLKPHALEDRVYRLRCVEAWSMVVPWVGVPLGDVLRRFRPTSRAKFVRVLPNQNGAPLRLVVPWKYGFKSIKAIVRVHFTERMPATAWNIAAPNEYGFYANVNPQVDHPRWSQKTERHIGAGLFEPRRPTLPFNGYAAQVAGLYSGLDLRRNF